MGSVLAFLLFQSKAVEQELLKSVTRDKRPCWALPADPQLEQQTHSKSGILSLDAGCTAAILSLQWEGQGQWLNSPQVIQIIWKKSACCNSDWALSSMSLPPSQSTYYWAVKVMLWHPFIVVEMYTDSPACRRAASRVSTETCWTWRSPMHCVCGCTSQGKHFWNIFFL